MNRLRSASGCVLAAFALAALPAAAQPAKPTPAEAIFREGREAAARGDMTMACIKFEESVKLARAAGPLLNVADCEERKGRLVSAAKHWREGIHLLDPSDDRLAFAKERAAALDKRLPRLTIRVTPETAGARVELDSVEVPPSEASEPQPVDPGDHKIVVKAGERSGRAQVSIAEGERKEVTVTLGAATGALPPTPERPAGSAMRTAGFIAGGVGVMGLAVFGVTAGLIESRRSTLSESCNEAKQCTPEGLEAAKSGKLLAPINAIALVAGVAGLGAGVTLLLLSPSPSKPAAALRASGAPGAFSASLVGTF